MTPQQKTLIEQEANDYAKETQSPGSLKMSQSYHDYIAGLTAAISNPQKYGIGGGWVKASERLPGIINKKALPKFVKHLKKTYSGEEYESIATAYYFPDRFKSIEFEDWNDYDEEGYPYTENDTESGTIWLRAGWYSLVECDNCESYWNAPLNVIEWLDESANNAEIERLREALEKIAEQKTYEEVENDRDMVHGDYEFGYSEIIKIARESLKPKEVNDG